MSRDNVVALVAVGVVAIGIVVIVLFTLRQPQTTALTPVPIIETPSMAMPEVVVDTPEPEAVLDNAAAIRAALATTLSRERAASAERAAMPASAPLPEMPMPAGAQLYELTPAAADVVGWARQDDENGNHFGDYNIYAGTFEGQVHVGGVQFDLSAIPPGAPIVHADLTLTGLSDEWLGETGTWTVALLEPWMDDGWNERNFHWLTRTESETAALAPSLTVDDLGVGRRNTLIFPPQLLAVLQTRLYTGQVSFRIVGPKGSGDNLFAWSSGGRGQSPLLRIVAGAAPATPPPSPTPHYVIVTPVDVLALAAERLTATAQAPEVETNGDVASPTPTPMPPNWVTPIIVVPTETPANEATAVWLAEVAQAQAIVYGTPTATPPNVWTATPTPLATATPLFQAYADLTPTPTATSTPSGIPAFLKGKILFYSDRTGGTQLMFMNPDGSDVALWQGDDWIYQEAKRLETRSPDGTAWVAVEREQVPVDQVFVHDINGRRQLTHFEELSYDPVWSPVEDRILFVSPEPGNDEIFSVWADGNDLYRLTANEWEWDKHPSWSPDGSEIAFFSNRSGQSQIYVMAADGSNLRQISDGSGEDMYPVWIK